MMGSSRWFGFFGALLLASGVGAQVPSEGAPPLAPIDESAFEPPPLEGEDAFEPPPLEGDDAFEPPPLDGDSAFEPLPSADGSPPPASGAASPPLTADDFVVSDDERPPTDLEPVEGTDDDDDDDDASARAQAFRSHSSFRGGTGGVHLFDAGSGLPGSFRVQLGIGLFGASDFLSTGDDHSTWSGVLSFSWTIIEHLEVFATIANRASSNTGHQPRLLQVLGDTTLGAKGYYAIEPWLVLGGDFSLVFLNSVGDIGLVGSGTSARFGFNASVDLRKAEARVPLIARFNLGYYLDNSSNLIEDVERARYDQLAAPDPDFGAETANLLNRQERFGLGINRVDQVQLGIGVEAPLKVSEAFYLQPILEYTLGIPLNRQGYVCLVETTDAGAGQPDGCLELQGLAAAPSNLTLGVRAFPPLNGLGVMLAFDIGLSGVNTFVRELAPNAPYQFRLALSYAYDTEPPVAAEPVEVVRTMTVLQAPPLKPRISGLVVEQGLGGAVEGAIVRYLGLPLSAQATDASGRFISYGLEPGKVELEVSHPDYETRVCLAEIPEHSPESPERAGGAAAPGQPAGGSGLAPVGADGQPMAGVPPVASPGLAAPSVEGTAAASAGPTGQLAADAVGGIGLQTATGDGAAVSPPASEGPASQAADPAAPMVDLRCELTAKPRFGSLLGTVVSEKDEPVVGAAVTLTGPSAQAFTTDAAGQFRADDLPPGTYGAKVDAEGYLLKHGSITISPAQEATPTLQLMSKPAKSQVQMSKKEVKIRRQVLFKSNSAEIDEKSFPLLTEVADVLMRNPQVVRVEIQGHTDNRGDPASNKALSQQRAESVRQWLVDAGVGTERLTAKGYGDARPLLPNLTPFNRARNRRVQFIIRDQQ